MYAAPRYKSLLDYCHLFWLANSIHAILFGYRRNNGRSHTVIPSDMLLTETFSNPFDRVSIGGRMPHDYGRRVVGRLVEKLSRNLLIVDAQTR